MPELEPLKVNFTNAQLVEPEDGFQIDKQVNAKYCSVLSREPTTKESKVFAKLCARYKGQTEELRQFQEEWIRNDGTWSTEFKLGKPLIYEKDKDKKDDAVIEYFTEIENKYAQGNFRSEMISVPVNKLKLEIKDMEGPKELVHNRSGAYKVKFNRKASDNEKNKVSWVVRINGEETDRFDNAGEKLEFTPIGKYAGETVTVHPFLRSPSDELCVETTVGECLVFDGSKLIWLDKKHNEKGKWEAVPGKNENSDPKKEDGPIPEGRWVVLQTKREIAEKDSWWENLINRKSANESSSNERIGLIPFSTTDTHQRDEVFYIQGSKEADIVPGINLEEGIDEFIESFVNSGKNLVLVVRYTELSQNNKFNNLDEKDIHSERKFIYLHPLGSGHNFQVTSPYGLRSLGMHYGIDYGVPEGTPLYAVTNADVERSYFHKGYGETVYINDGKNTFVYAHLSERSVRSGSKVQKGQIIGCSGNTGRSTGPHLHFEVRINKGIYPSNTLNPQEFGF